MSLPSYLVKDLGAYVQDRADKLDGVCCLDAAPCQPHGTKAPASSPASWVVLYHPELLFTTLVELLLDAFGPSTPVCVNLQLPDHACVVAPTQVLAVELPPSALLLPSRFARPARLGHVRLTPISLHAPLSMAAETSIDMIAELTRVCEQVQPVVALSLLYCTYLTLDRSLGPRDAKTLAIADWIGDVLLDVREYKLAIAWLTESSTASSPDARGRWTNLGFAHLQRMDTKRAVEYYERVARAVAGTSEIWSAAIDLAGAHRFAKALGPAWALLESVHSAPLGCERLAAEAQHAAGLVLANMHRWSLAVESLHRAYHARKTLLGGVHVATSASFYALYYVYVTSSEATFSGRSSLHQFLATECDEGMVPWGGRRCVAALGWLDVPHVHAVRNNVAGR
ncbi:hypothetical protein SDRG_08092 [Saprolegnia diclina VS20]|uniref:Uncharacterized protein n=1 Tax=Saprolegnia diclina (strain VS20) TaxID=1156394 RepID=T0Q8U5_SAPDV|nr:hypothetical protein SDRG_08092 [Saprolegnia diclina VS20]EQC34319.1 hypothetical protein SDRG_08092 [Saprolegnia diclina VS20]|eukprot:XP_008612181.1 hypothetical protein SDRG_08092 [Saprolegnia diclina VS20]